MNQKILEVELEKNKSDKELGSIELELSKDRFAKEMSGFQPRTFVLQPVTYKKPWKFRLKEWQKKVKLKIKVFLGLSNGTE